MTARTLTADAKSETHSWRRLPRLQESNFYGYLARNHILPRSLEAFWRPICQNRRGAPSSGWQAFNVAKNMRAKTIIVCCICLALAVGCAYQMFSAGKNIFSNSPAKISPSNINKTEQFEQWFGSGRSRHKESVTIFKNNTEQSIVIGMNQSDGWVLPVLHREKYIRYVDGATASTTILQFYRFHPYLSYSIGFIVCFCLFTFCSCICIQRVTGQFNPMNPKQMKPIKLPNKMLR